jgi:hypothetical protein
MKQRNINQPETRRDTIKTHLMEEHRHDPYKSRDKLTEPTVCPQCSAVFANGRRQWMDKRPEIATEMICSACHRISDGYPAGEVTLDGAFLRAHREEILALARNVAAAEKRQHALQRIIAVSEADDRMIITTTDVHLPRRIGHAIVDAYKGHSKRTTMRKASSSRED